jgi:hypothetical protein
MRRRLIVALDGLPSLRDATASPDVDLAAAATLASTPCGSASPRT